MNGGGARVEAQCFGEEPLASATAMAGAQVVEEARSGVARTIPVVLAGVGTSGRPRRQLVGGRGANIDHIEKNTGARVELHGHEAEGWSVFVMSACGAESADKEWACECDRRAQEYEERHYDFIMSLLQARRDDDEFNEQHEAMNMTIVVQGHHHHFNDHFVPVVARREFRGKRRRTWAPDESWDIQLIDNRVISRDPL